MILWLLVKYSLCAIKSTLTTPMSFFFFFFFFQFRCQQVSSLHQISLATVQNQTWICTQSKLRSSWCLVKNEAERIYSCFLLKSDVCLLQSQHQNDRSEKDIQKERKRVCRGIHMTYDITVKF